MTVASPLRSIVHHLVSVRTVDLAFFHECAVCVAFKSDFRYDVPVILVTGTTEPVSESSVCFHCNAQADSTGSACDNGNGLLSSVHGSVGSAIGLNRLHANPSLALFGPVHEDVKQRTERRDANTKFWIYKLLSLQS